MSTRPLHELRDEARSARSRGDFARAQGALFAALQHTTAREEDYTGAAAELRDVLAHAGNFRAALTLDWYAGNDKSQRQLIGRVPPIDRARTLLAWADRDADRDRARGVYAKAADESRWARRDQRARARAKSPPRSPAMAAWATRPAASYSSAALA